MNVKLHILFWVLLAAAVISCNKEPVNADAGEFTIDNTLYGYGPYYAIGFSFEQGQKVQTNDSPPPDITIHARTDAGGNISGAYLDTPNLVASFALAAALDTEQEAAAFFDNLLTVGTYNWTLFADDIGEHSVYVFKTVNDNYVKFVIKDLVLNDTDDGPFAEVTIKWQIQADGSTTFDR